MSTNKKLIVNSDKGNLLNELVSSINKCKRFYFSVAFLNFSGLQLLLEPFKEAEKKGVQGKIITSTYLNFTETKALKKVNEFQNIQLKVFDSANSVGFHTKAYIFEYENFFKIIIGSSNMTQSALKSNVEWNVEVVVKNDEAFLKEVLEEYDVLWNSSVYADDLFIYKYEEFLHKLRSYTNNQTFIYEKVCNLIRKKS